MKTLVFLAGMVPFRNSDERKDVYFLDLFDNVARRRKTKLGRLLHKIRKGLHDISALLTHRDADCFIFFESGASYRRTRLLMKVLNLLYPQSRRILYVRNRIKNQSRRDTVEYAKKLGYELWTYDEADSKLFNLKFNPQVLDRSLFSKSLNQENVYSTVFVGNTKGREKVITTLWEQLNELGLNTLFYVHDYNNAAGTSKVNTQSKLIPYEEYVTLIEKSASIIDIVNDRNYGLTVRPLEALFTEKKLITNYPEIVHYDFYHEDNIFIFNENNISQIPAWLEKPYHPIDETILAGYDIDAWLERFEV